LTDARMDEIGFRYDRSLFILISSSYFCIIIF